MSTDREILEFEFCQWLTDNGAKFPKILWPSSQTEGGVRGAIALDDIESLEPMLEIPTILMMSPPVIFRDEVIGSKMQASLDLLQGDLLLTVFLMYELTKKDKSFYYPYLRILPEPGNVSEWTNEELLELQDNEIILRTKSRQRMMNNMYHRTVHGLSRKYPETFPLESFTYDLFKFAWNTIQARAFGRRLKWTALVPFADCLNHNNVQTKYDCDVDGNGVFRLFPSGENHYKKGKEVFNSYGRRPNENLLSDYGFAMLHNEWDEVEVALDLPEYEPNYDFKRRALYSMGMHSNKRFKLRKNEIPYEALVFLRIVCLTEKQMDHMLDIERAEVEARGGYSDDDDDEFGVNEISMTSDKEDGKASRDSRRATREVVKYYDKVLSLDNEVKALQFLLNILQSLAASYETTLQEDEVLLQRINEAREREEEAAKTAETASAYPSIADTVEDSEFKFSWRLWSAVHYRLTRKHIIASVRSLVEELLRIVEALKVNVANTSEVSFLFEGVILPASSKTIKPRRVRYSNEVRAHMYDLSQPASSMLLNT